MIPMNRVTRRTLFRGMMGGAAISVGLPFLDCFLNENGTALAATGAPLPVCFGTWFWGCGLTPGRWVPAKIGSDYDLPIELQPLAPYKDKLNVYSGMKVHLDGKAALPHFTGDMAVLTGTVPRDRASLPSVDSLIADSIGTKTRFRSLEVASTGKTSDSLSRRNGSVVNPAEISPAALYTRVFGPEFKDPNAADFAPDPRVMVRRSVLSAVTDQRAAFAKQLGTADRARLDEYFTSLRELEQQLDLELQKPAPLEACTTPMQPASTETGTDIDRVNTNHKLFAGLLAHALACNQTHVFNVIYADATSSLRRAGSPMTHHILTHEEPVDVKLGYQPNATWFIGQIIEGLHTMVAALDGIREGDGTLLDRTLVMATSETGYAKVHSLENIPMLTIGKAGGRVKTGIHFEAKGDPVSRLGLTMQQAYGVPVDTWGTESMQTSKTITEVIA